MELIRQKVAKLAQEDKLDKILKLKKPEWENDFCLQYLFGMKCICSTTVKLFSSSHSESCKLWQRRWLEIFDVRMNFLQQLDDLDPTHILSANEHKIEKEYNGWMFNLKVLELFQNKEYNKIKELEEPEWGESFVLSTVYEVNPKIDVKGIWLRHSIGLFFLRIESEMQIHIMNRVHELTPPRPPPSAEDIEKGIKHMFNDMQLSTAEKIKVLNNVKLYVEKDDKEKIL